MKQTHHRDGTFWVLGGLCLVMALSVPYDCQAQVLYGSIVGNVKDPSDAAVPGATVTITNQDTSQTRETITNEVGSFTFATVQTGAYTVKVDMTGFRESIRRDVQVTLNTAARVDIGLEVGQLSDTVTVSAAATTLQTDRTEVKAELPTRA